MAGAIAAAVVGYVHWNCGTRFGLPLILFYLSSSKVGCGRCTIYMIQASISRRASRRIIIMCVMNAIMCAADTLAAGRERQVGGRP
jgi:hypothetical protein